MAEQKRSTNLVLLWNGKTGKSESSRRFRESKLDGSQSFSPALRFFSCLFLFSSASLNTTDHKKLRRRHEREGSPKCYYCDTDENITVEHFLLSCSKYEEIRSELLCQLQGELEAIGATGFQVSILWRVKDLGPVFKRRATLTRDQTSNEIWFL